VRLCWQKAWFIVQGALLRPEPVQPAHVGRGGFLRLHRFGASEIPTDTMRDLGRTVIPESGSVRLPKSLSSVKLCSLINKLHCMRRRMMIRKSLLILLLLMPVLAQAKKTEDISSYLLGSWQVEAVKEDNAAKFHPPHHAVNWEFNPNGELIETLGKNGAKIHWHYRVIGREIKVQTGNLAFRWRILSMEPKLMLIRHQLGLFKVKRL
jgi:hypothetical protein